jgi:hypothetical protein
MERDRLEDLTIDGNSRWKQSPRGPVLQSGATGTDFTGPCGLSSL